MFLHNTQVVPIMFPLKCYLLWYTFLYYNVCQLCGITRLVRSFCHSADGILFQRLYKAPNNIWKIPRDPLTKFYSWPSLFSSPRQPFLAGVLISRTVAKAVWWVCVDHIQLWDAAVCKLPYQTDVPIMPNNIRSVIIENIVRFSGLWLSQKEMWRITGVSQGAIWKKSPTSCSWEQQCYTGATSASIEYDHIKRTVLFVSRSKKSFLSVSRIRVVLNRQIQRCVFVRTVQGRLLVAGYYSRHHRCRRHMLADWSQS